HAWLRQEHLAAAASLIARRFGRGLELTRIPSGKYVGRLDDDPQAHVRVLEATKFSTLPAIDTGSIRDESKIILMAGDEIFLPSKLGHPETMDDVACAKFQAHRTAGRQVEF